MASNEISRMYKKSGLLKMTLNFTTVAHLKRLKFTAFKTNTHYQTLNLWVLPKMDHFQGTKKKRPSPGVFSKV
jgi:hypothetical protein